MKKGSKTSWSPRPGELRVGWGISGEGSEGVKWKPGSDKQHLADLLFEYL